MKEYMTPDFDVTIYEVNDEITASSPDVEIGKNDPNGNDDDWFG